MLKDKITALTNWYRHVKIDLKYDMINISFKNQYLCAISTKYSYLHAFEIHFILLSDSQGKIHHLTMNSALNHLIGSDDFVAPCVIGWMIHFILLNAQLDNALWIQIHYFYNRAAGHWKAFSAFEQEGLFPWKPFYMVVGLGFWALNQRTDVVASYKGPMSSPRTKDRCRRPVQRTDVVASYDKQGGMGTESILASYGKWERMAVRFWIVHTL